MRKQRRVLSIVTIIGAAVLLSVSGAWLVGGGAAPTTGGGIFHTVCAYSHSLPDDPIVFPGKPGASHMHDFFGNTTTDNTSTLASLQAGTSNCFVHAANTDADHSGYWVPQLIFNGTPTPFIEAQAYYDSTVGTVQTPPTGLEVIGGNAHATAPLSTNIVKWTCSGGQGNAIGALHRTTGMPVRLAVESRRADAQLSGQRTLQRPVRHQ